MTSRAMLAVRMYEKGTLVSDNDTIFPATFALSGCKKRKVDTSSVSGQRLKRPYYAPPVQHRPARGTSWNVVIVVTIAF